MTSKFRSLDAEASASESAYFFWTEKHALVSLAWCDAETAAERRECKRLREHIRKRIWETHPNPECEGRSVTHPAEEALLSELAEEERPPAEKRKRPTRTKRPAGSGNIGAFPSSEKNAPRQKSLVG